MIISDKLSVKIGDKYILQDISAQIENGKITTILGPNGAGKSTLLKCLTGAQKANHGIITLDGKNLNDYSLSELSTKRAVLSQSTPINFPFTVLEIVVMGRTPYSSSDHKNHQIALEALESVDALHLKDRIFPTLSGGEQQRVQLARVLAQLWEQKDAYLFLDEPTSALDLKHQHQLLSIVSELAEEKNFAVCLIMHDLNLALRYSHYVLLLKQGKIYISGTAEHALSDNNLANVFEIPASLALGV